MRATRGDTAAPAAAGAEGPTRARRLRLALFMTGIQYSTVRTDATGGPASLPHRAFVKAAARSAMHPWHSSGVAEAAGKAHSPAAPAGKTPAGVSRFTGTRREER